MNLLMPFIILKERSIYDEILHRSKRIDTVLTHLYLSIIIKEFLSAKFRNLRYGGLRQE